VNGSGSDPKDPRSGTAAASLPAQAGTAFRDVPVQLHHWLARVGEVDVPAFDFSARQELPGVMATANVGLRRRRRGRARRSEPAARAVIDVRRHHRTFPLVRTAVRFGGNADSEPPLN
jgi:hypothetical protein